MFSTHLRYALFSLCVGLLASVHGHGRLVSPPSRSSMWRYGFNTPKNYNDIELFCGGMAHQWNQMGGKCGVCGDPYDGVRKNEAGGIYATGTIGKVYKEGEIITADVQLTANHLGWFEFRLCVNNDIHKKATHECLNKNLLQLADGSGTRLHIGSRKGHYLIKLKLPTGVTCEQCVFQWKYHTGNTWRGSKERVCQGTVCTDAQEEFYGCADVAIQSKNANTGGMLGRSTRRPIRNTTPKPWRRTTWGRITRRPIRNTTPKPWRRTTRGRITRRPIINTTPKPRRRTTQGPHHRRSTPRHTKLCRATGVWTGNFKQDAWCRINCRLHNCPKRMCRCD